MEQCHKKLLTSIYNKNNNNNITAQNDKKSTLSSKSFHEAIEKTTTNYHFLFQNMEVSTKVCRHFVFFFIVKLQSIKFFL